MLMRTRTDANTGTKYNEFFGRKSLIGSSGREGRRVASLVRTPTMSVLWGAPLRQAR